MYFAQTAFIQGEHISLASPDGSIISSFENRSWYPYKSFDRYPHFTCPLPIGNALYKLAIEELDNLIEKDTTWRTGKWWGVRQ